MLAMVALRGGSNCPLGEARPHTPTPLMRLVHCSIILEYLHRGHHEIWIEGTLSRACRDADCDRDWIDGGARRWTSLVCVELACDGRAARSDRAIPVACTWSSIQRWNARKFVESASMTYVIHGRATCSKRARTSRRCRGRSVTPTYTSRSKRMGTRSRSRDTEWAIEWPLSGPPEGGANRLACRFVEPWNFQASQIPVWRHQEKKPRKGAFSFLAERQGFEPWNTC